jgi:hypothetical protein
LLLINLPTSWLQVSALNKVGFISEIQKVRIDSFHSCKTIEHRKDCHNLRARLENKSMHGVNASNESAMVLHP